MSESLAAKADSVRTTAASSAAFSAADQEAAVPAGAGLPSDAGWPRSAAAVPWQTAMKRAIRSTDDLCRRLALPAPFRTTIRRAAEQNPFPLFAPLEFVARMRPGDPDDPLLRQVLPLPEEAEPAAGFTCDPVGEVAGPAAASLDVGLLRKYHGRALLVASGACGVHCRYCFRRHFPYDHVPRGNAQWEQPLQRIQADLTIDEVILSGGDPLVLTDPVLASLVEKIARVPHVRRLRIHSRMPIVIPQRVTAALVEMLRATRLAVWMVVHANHPAELDAMTLAHLARLIDAGIPVLNQTVLLRGVNDDAAVLEALCRRLIDHRMQPYYLHQLDRVAGAAHFETPEATGQEIIAALRSRLPGYAVPTYVVERAGESSKTPL